MTNILNWLLGGAVALAALGTATAASAENMPAGPWKSAHNLDHPLVGQIWSLADNKRISPEALIKDLGKADAVLLGEIHDNPDHHALQAWVVAEIAKTGKKPAVVYEMIPLEFAEPLAAFLETPRHGAAGLGQLLKWNERGWPDWETYEPIAEAALEAGLRIKAGDLGKESQRRISREGLDALEPSYRDRLGVNLPLETNNRENLMEKLHEGHCRMMPKEALAPMLGVQRARDAVMADAVLSEAKAGGAILIAGAGHTRNDWAVPWYLARRAPDKTVRTVAFVEADPDLPEPADYELVGADGKPMFDFVWFTPRATLTDHCAELREQFAKMKAKKNKKDTE